MSVDEVPADDLTPPVPEPREYVVPGLILGIVAWVAGAALTAALGVGLSQVGTDPFGGAPTWRTVAWLYVDTHLAPLVVAGVTTTASVVAGIGGPSLALAVVPVVVVSVAGVLAVGRVGVPGPVEGAKGGAAVALGYLVSTAVSWLVVDGTVVVDQVTYTLAPTPVTVLVVGLVYPAVVGAVGGVLASR